MRNPNGPGVMSLASQLEGPRSDSLRHQARFEAGHLLSIGASVANVIKAPCYLVHASSSLGNKTDRHDMT